MSSEKPSLPETYKRPEIWTEGDMGGFFGGINRPTAGARSEEELPKGEHPIQLYSLATPNGQKITIMLEELGVGYDAWKVDIIGQKQFTSGFVAANPNSKIPVMLDLKPGDVDGSEPLRVFESGSILFYLAEKYGKLLPKDDIRKRTEVMNWLMFQMGSAPYIGGGLGHFYHYAPIHIEYAINRFAMEVKRQMDVLDQHLADGSKEFMVGEELTIADIALWPWVRALFEGAYEGVATFLQMDQYQHLQRWYKALAERKAFMRGIRVNGWTEGSLSERHSKDDFAPEEY